MLSFDFMDSSGRLWGNVLQGVEIGIDKSSEAEFPRLDQYFHFFPSGSLEAHGEQPFSPAREDGWSKGFHGAAGNLQGRVTSNFIFKAPKVSRQGSWAQELARGRSPAPPQPHLVPLHWNFPSQAFKITHFLFEILADILFFRLSASLP